jgi:NTP pyrophosphatase (non-canonical NTP hydrolase)
LDEARGWLREELADAVIYIMRLSAILGADLEQDILDKMAQNDARYRPLESE